MSQDNILPSSTFGKGTIATAAIFALLGVALLVSLNSDYHRGLTDPPLSSMAATQPALAKGDKLFQQNCAICHGVSGDGNGVTAALLEPKPRNFHVGKYRLITAANGVPSRDDIIRSIRHGMPGTSMPSWVDLTDEQLGTLADYVMAISRHSLRETLRPKFASPKLKPEALEKKLDKVVADRLKPEDPAHPTTQPAFTAEDLVAAKALFTVTCAVCHGADGKGMQNPEWKTEEGYPIASRNFRSGVFKGGGRGEDIYHRIYSGIPGTPMPAFNTIPDRDIWRLVHYVQAMASPEGTESWVFKNAPATQPAAAAAAAPLIDHSTTSLLVLKQETK